MLESEQHVSKEERKARIRKRYEGIDQSRIRVIPAKPKKGIYDSDRIVRVGVYARVSTSDPNQTSSYELQKMFYENMVERNPNWELVDIYADEGISGTSLNHRDGFMRLMDDCMNGKIDLVITKSVSRFARNLEDCVHYVKMLTNKRPPTGILFESEGIYTLNENVELSLSMNASMAQEESHIKSVGMNRSYDMRFDNGIFLKPVLLGYDHDDEGNLIINEKEARIVRLIFLMFVSNHPVGDIAREMTRLGVSTKLGNTVWAAQSIVSILRNERHCGDVLARKTITPNYLDHKSVKNDGEKPQYYVEDDHKAIVSREMYHYVQMKLDQIKYGFQTGTPDLKVIQKGVLRGFVQINPCWMGFTADDYMNACASVLTDADYLNPIIRIRRNKGDYDFRSYQVTRCQFVPQSRRISVSLNQTDLKFSKDAVYAMRGVPFVEMFVHPLFQMIVVRAGNKKDKHSAKWCEISGEKKKARRIKAKGFMPILYELFEWDMKYRYTLTGIIKEQGNERILLFFADEPEIRMYENGRMKIGYRKDWIDSFGDEYLTHEAKERAMFDPEVRWQLSEPGITANGQSIPQFPMQGIKEDIEALKLELAREVQIAGKTAESEEIIHG